MRNGRSSKRNAGRVAVRPPRALSHADATRYSVDYLLGRLSPELNAAMEAHVQSCAHCQREGLLHAPTQKREVERQYSRVRPKNPRSSQRRRRVVQAAVLVLACLGLALIVSLTPAVHDLSAFLASHTANPATAESASGTGTAAPRILTGKNPLQGGGQVTTSVALSPDNHLLAGAQSLDGQLLTTVWKAANGMPLATLAWPGTVAPQVLTWSPDGTLLAATDGQILGVWSVSSHALLWNAPLPTGDAMRVYSAITGTVAQQLDPNTAFATSPLLQWGTNGTVATAPAGAAEPTGVISANDPLIGLWQQNGTHLFPDGSATVGTVEVGAFSASDSLLSWSSDGTYLFWGHVHQQLALDANAPQGTPSATPANALQPPNALMREEGARLAHYRAGDALVWFSPHARRLALCDRSQGAVANLNVYDISTGQALASIHGVCPHLQRSGLTWTGNSLYVALPDAPLAVYSVPPALS